MAKKAQATPRARYSRASRPLDTERWNRLLIVGGVVAVILVAVGFIAYGWYDTKVRPLSKTVLAVGDTEFSLAHFERRLELEKNENPAVVNTPELVFGLPDDLLATLEFEATLLESAPELNVTVTDEDVANEVKRIANLAEDAEPKFYANAFRDQVDESGLTESEYRQKLRAELLANRVREYFIFLAPASEPQVKARWMSFDTSESAQQALDRPNAGEDFTLVAQEQSRDGSPLERDWAPRGGSASLTLPTEVEDFLFGAQPGQRSEVISVANTYYVAELQDRDDNRPLDDGQRQQVGQREMQDWLRDKNGDLTVTRDLTDDDKLKALRDAFPELF